MMLEVRIVEVSVTRMGFAIVLKPLTRSKVVPIFIGPLETYSISSALDGQESERPLTHDLMKNVLENLKYGLEKVVVNDFSSGTFFARMFLKKIGSARGTIEMDSRPSDAIALAIRFNVPIFMEETVYDKVAVDVSILRDKKMEEAEELLSMLEESIPEEGMGDDHREDMIQTILEEFGDSSSVIKGAQQSDLIPKKLKGSDNFQTKEEVLEQMLKVAVKKEAYEEAARLRDELREMRSTQMMISQKKIKKTEKKKDDQKN